MPKGIKKIIILIITILGFSYSIQETSAQFAGLPMSDLLSSYSQYSSIYYHFGGNNFGGMIFLSGTTNISGGENIFINGENSSIKCSYRLNGFYYNNLRGQRLRPLDTESAQELIIRDYNYNNISINGGLYTNCTGGTVKSNEIYGQITHQWGGMSYNITAGLAINTTGNSIIQPGSFSGSMKIVSGRVEGLLHDNYGGAGELGPVKTTSSGNIIIIGTSTGFMSSQCGSFKVTATNGTNISLSCSGSNVTNYMLNLFESSDGKIVMATNGTTSPYLRNFSVPKGNYIASCTTNIGNSSCNQIAISNLSGELFTSELGIGQIVKDINIINAISRIRHAKLKTTYTSEDIVVRGLVSPTLARVNKGYLIINGTGVGTTGYVNNGDIITIELISSKNYDSTTSASLFIGGMFGTFSVITEDNSGNECNISKTEKLKVAQIFEFIKAGYSSTPTKRANMLYVLQSMTQDIQDFDYNCSLQYLMDLTNDEIENGDSSDGDETEHTAPNCKVYSIDYDEDNDSYTSNDFKEEQLFASREALIRFIDSQNPGDCHVNIYTNETFDYIDTDTTHAAPNGKIYTIESSADGLFSSSTMTSKKTFDTKEGLITYIDKYNPQFVIRDHTVDTSRDPITFATANNKEYKIYKTDKGYMSYKLVKIKYFESKDAIIEYIDKNNK